jgi:hypothetical protein
MELAPEVSHVDLAPEVPHVELTPEPEVPPIELTPEVPHVELAPEVPHVQLTPEVSHAEITPEAAHVELAPEVSHKELTPELRPEVEPVDIISEATDAEEVEVDLGPSCPAQVQVISYTAKILYRKLEKNIPRKETARPQSQFPFMYL